MLNYDVLLTKDGLSAKVVPVGVWSMYEILPKVPEVFSKIRALKPTRVVINASKMDSWDTSFISFILELKRACAKFNLAFDESTLPEDVLSILELVKNSESEKSANSSPKKRSIRKTFHDALKKTFAVCKDGIGFLGDVILESLSILCGRSKFRSKEFLIISEQVGIRALGIVALIGFLVGLILAFISIVQLTKMGAGIYCADLVGIAMMREMGCLMTAIIMSGRTGAAFAATIGTMVVNEEIDAIQTSGLSSFRFIIIPRMLALALMMPLLCIFADLIGIAGGMFAAITMLDMNITQYLSETQSAIVLGDFFCGLVKSVFFAFLIAGIGCWQGMRCGRDAEAVGQATTNAVVESITAIIMADAVFAVIFNALGV